jgi:hypothetical protein
MGRSLRVLILIVSLGGCGGGFPNALPVGFVNQTQHSDADLWTIWKSAQQSVAQEVDLNPLERSFHQAPPDLRPGDPRALRAMPHQLRVAAVPDVSSGALFAATGVYRADPTGLISCPQPCNVHYAAAYSWYPRQLTKYAASWEFQGDNFSIILQYEFENQILNGLGYDMKWR